ncbi:MAG: hypothetical protein HYW06_07590 [Gemmatimonadetes bacterium]|nr:hypothetical protein [Gemmatimonadota bacterium]MBI2403855.1 hypothetical protein [Gemmatimonadota bacterium]MBI2536811.1 hypothetical protein [Gemmatimonadota bacterium]MBI3081450.1 hypothetical protein [Gemmatimonadota bacterium]
MLARRVGLVLCGIVLAASGAAGVVSGPDQWRTATTSAERWLGPIALFYGVTGFGALWGLMHPGRWMWPVFGAWAVAVVAAAALGTLLSAEPPERFLTTTYTVVVATVFVGAVVGFARRALTRASGDGADS